MRSSLAIGLSALLLAVPAAAQVTAPIGTPGVPTGAGGTSAAFGGGTMGPYTGGVPGGTSAATGAGTMGPTTGGGYSGTMTGSGYQLGPYTTTGTDINTPYSSGLNSGSLGAFNAGSVSSAGSTFANQSAMSPLRYTAPITNYSYPSIVPTASAIPSIQPTTPMTSVDTFTTTQSTGFALPVPGANATGTIRNSTGVGTQP